MVGDITIKFLVTFVLSLIFGLERQRSYKPIGFVTYIFVAMGSCGLSIASLLIASDNPLPLLSAIVTGIGFLGAGALIKTSDKILGFTTAASIWIFAIFGLLIGIGMYSLAFTIYISVLIVVLIDRVLERHGIGSYQKRLTIILNKNIHSGELAKIFGTKRYKVDSVDIDFKKKTYMLSLIIKGKKSILNRIPVKLQDIKEVTGFKFE
jgi:putative Mg2+ transporter-C (MgtC) family protein